MSAGAPGGVRLTVAASDTAHARWISGLGDVADGVVVVQARPGTRRDGWLAADVLAAMGKRRDVTGKGRNHDQDWALASIWLTAHSVGDIIVTDLANLPDDVAEALLRLAAGAGATLWLVADHAIDEPLAQLLAQWPVTAVARPAFDAHWQERTTDRGETPTSAAGDGWPDAVPDADFPVFRAEARRLLTADEFAAVDAAYTQAHAATGLWLASADVTEQTVAEHLRDLLTGCTTSAQMTTSLRAAQVAAFTAGWYVQADLLRLLAAGDATVAAAGGDPATWRKLRAYRDPHRGAICALTAAGLDIAGQQQLRIGDVADDGTSVHTSGRAVVVRPDAAVYLRAAVQRRRSEGASDDETLLTIATGTPMRAKGIADVIAAAMRELGVALVSGQVLRSDSDHASWLRRRGVSVTHLAVDDAQKQRAATARKAQRTKRTAA